MIEVMIASVVTAIVGLAVWGTVSAVQTGVGMQDDVAQETARIARAQARLADHLYRARLILGMSETVACLWLPSEEFDGSSANATNYDTIHADELRWYVIDTANRTISVQRVANHSDRTVYALSTNWATLRNTLAAANALESSTVLQGVASGAFEFTTFDTCSTRRIVLDVQFDNEHGGFAVELGGILAMLQRHPDCL
jgi:hypothetical protein